MIRHFKIDYPFKPLIKKMIDFPRSLNYDIESSLLNNDGNIEIEAKLRKLDLNKSEFIRLIKTFQEEDKYDEKNSFSIDYYQKNKRFTETLKGVYITTKTSLMKPKIFDFKDIEIKITVSDEELKESSVPKRYLFKRNKNRTSFIEGNLQLDLTEIQQDEIISYEVEIEVIDYKIFNYQKFTKKIIEIYDVIKNPYMNIINFFNISMGGYKDNKVLNYNLISKPRDLNFRDITNDGLLDHYTISIKADGVQKFLVFHKTGIWLLWPIRNDVENSYFWISPLVKDFEYLENSIFTGELLNEENFKSNKSLQTNYIYLPFDTTFYKGQNVSGKNYLERREFLKELNGKKIGKEIEINEKKIFIYEKTSCDFHQKVRDAFNYQDRVNYTTDGLIFTPIYSPYISKGQYQSKKK